jgi:rRNA maturation endonuclease Nob1
MNELLSLFEKATSKQSRPETETMAKVIKRVESDGKAANIPASEIVNIDLEVSMHSREVLQTGLVDL